MEHVFRNVCSNACFGSQLAKPRLGLMRRIACRITCLFFALQDGLIWLSLPDLPFKCYEFKSYRHP
jgi:hypothetical protein